MYLILKSTGPTTLECQALEFLKRLVGRARVEDEDQVLAATRYLDGLTPPLRARLAREVGAFLGCRGGPGDMDRSVGVWMAACFDPGTGHVPLRLEDLGSGGLATWAFDRVLMELDAIPEFRTTSLTFGLKAYFPDPFSRVDSIESYQGKFQKLDARLGCLTRVTLGRNCTDDMLTAVGHACQGLHEVALSHGNKITDAGFSAFARSQAGNRSSLRRISISRSPTASKRITLEGLSLVWTLPLPSVTYLSCSTQHLTWSSGKEDYLRCPNGGSKVVHLTIECTRKHMWERPNIARFMERVGDLMPALSTVDLKDLDEVYVDSIPASVQQKVRELSVFDATRIGLAKLARSFENVEVFEIHVRDNPDEEDLNLHGFLRRVEKFVCETSYRGGPSFKAFRAVLAAAENVKVVTVHTPPEGASDYTDEAMADLVSLHPHLSKLQVLDLWVDDLDGAATYPLTEATVSLLAAHCPNLGRLGNLSCWHLDPRWVSSACERGVLGVGGRHLHMSFVQKEN